ncbi:VOC family protein [Bacillus badius]|uniref:Glyoxalase n=1 Tax=Bacillus badius TaxID=1455 RepID=A0ABR5AP68_BACBA|nr:VOC family protein [Bacillus badius]KIL74146.1 Glyoxalase [Bacillus badius]KIL74774.1 Glyoxalase [Bacillus badius]MED4718372.1 VOC family protein [Bacillus badius]
MLVNGFYPVILTEKLEESSNFYETNFGFEPVFKSDWYVSLKMNESSVPYELAIISSTHKTIPSNYRKVVQGLILNFEVDNVDDEYERLIHSEKLPIIQDIKDEDFGQRHFITSDPNGILIDVIQIIPPNESYRSQFNEKIWSEK